MISLFASALLVMGQSAIETQRVPDCASIYFVGFMASRASIVSGETRWEGSLEDYDPSTDISAALRLCPMRGAVTFATVSGDVTVAVPSGLTEVYIVVDARDVGASKAVSEAPLFD